MAVRYLMIGAVLFFYAHKNFTSDMPYEEIYNNRNPELYVIASELPGFLNSTTSSKWRLDLSRLWELNARKEITLIFLNKSDKWYISKDGKHKLSYDAAYRHNETCLKTLRKRYPILNALYSHSSDVSAIFDEDYMEFRKMIFEEKERRGIIIISTYNDIPITKMQDYRITSYPQDDAKRDYINKNPRIYMAYDKLPQIAGSECFDEQIDVNYPLIWRLFSEGKVQIINVATPDSGYDTDSRDGNTYYYHYICAYNIEMLKQLTSKYPNLLSSEASEELYKIALSKISIDHDPVYFRVKRNLPQIVRETISR